MDTRVEWNGGASPKSDCFSKITLRLLAAASAYPTSDLFEDTGGPTSDGRTKWTVWIELCGSRGELLGAISVARIATGSGTVGKRAACCAASRPGRA